LSEYATIEFWVAAIWTDLDYDLTILSFIGPEGSRFPRIWEAPLDANDIATFKHFDVTSERGRRHPMIDALVAISHFSDGRRDILLLREPIPTALLADIDERVESVPDKPGWR
jgi:hypothetical protein